MAMVRRWLWVTLFFAVLNVVGLSVIAWKVCAPVPPKEDTSEKLPAFVSPTPPPPPAPLRPFAIEEAEGYTSTRNESYVRVSCTESPKAEKIKEYVQVDPPVLIRATADWHGFKLYGKFEPGQKYKITCLKGMPGANGQRLATNSIRPVTMPDLPSRLKFLTSGVYLMSEGQRILPIETLNAKSLTITVSKAYSNNLVHYLYDGGEYRASERFGRKIAEWTVTPESPKKNKPVTTYLDLSEILMGEEAGAYYIQAKTPDYGRGRDSQIVLMSDLGLTIKEGRDDLTIWVVALSTGQPVPGAAVKVFSRKNQEVASGVTDETGVFRQADLDLSDEHAPFALLAEKDGDIALMKMSDCRVDTSRFSTGGRSYLHDGYETYAYMDRAIYRPGETAHASVIMRSSDCSLPGEFPVTLRVTRPDGRTWKELAETLSYAGTIHADLALPPEAQTGRYWVSALLPGETNPIGSVTFQVEEFMPDRLKASVAALEKTAMAGEEIPFTVSGHHLFGAPAADRKVTAQFEVRNREFRHSDWEDFSFRDENKTFPVLKLGEFEGKLNQDGKCAISGKKIPIGLKTPSALTLLCTATVHEVGGRGVTATASCSVDSYPRYAGIRQTSTRWPKPSEEVSFECALVRPDGSPVEAGTLSAKVYRIWWQTVCELDRRGRYEYHSERVEELAQESQAAIVEGRGTLVFTPPVVGEYQVRVADETGGSSATLNFHCSGDGSAPWDMRYPDRLEIVLDKESYEPGETARAVIKTPFGGTALFTVETERIHFQRVIPLDGNTATVEVPVDAAWGSNAYCSAAVIHRDSTDASRPIQRAFGVAPLKINVENRRLAITIEAPETCRPDEPLRIDLQALDASSLPSSCEVTIAAVDEGICRLMPFDIPDPFNFFFAQRRLGVSTYDIYSLLMPEFERPKATSDSDPGGGWSEEEGSSYDPNRFNPVHADRVKPVALWSGPLLTDENGHATVTLNLPSAFNGRLRLIAVAAGEDGFGSAEGWVTVKAPLMLRTALPRFLAPNDEFVLPVTAFNNTDTDRFTTLSVASEEIVIDGDAERLVEVPAGRDASAFFSLKSPAIPGVVKITVTATAGTATVSEETELAVRPSAPRQVLCGAGSLPTGEGVDISLPGDWLAGTQKFHIVCSARPGMELLGGLRYVMKYPYGCLEQTTSRCFPLLYLSDLAEAEGLDAYTHEEVAGFVEAGIERILTMQTSRGSFSLWPGHYDAYPWGSTYATHFLVEADRAGYDVPQNALNRALDALEKMLPGDDFSEDAKAYACYVLANAGRSGGAWCYRLYERREHLSASALFHVAAALALSDEKDLAKELIYAPLPILQTKRETGGTLNSPVREKAIMLSACLDADPESSRAAAWAKDLTSAMKNGRWLTTQDNAFALMALGKYFRIANRKPDNWTAEVQFSEGESERFSHVETFDRTFTDSDQRNIHLAASGEGSVNYYWSSEGVPLSGKIEDCDQGIKIRRTFSDHNGKALPLDAIPLGEIIIVHITVQADHRVENVVISDLLPACFEIDNPNIATSETGAGRRGSVSKTESLYARHIERRDDRLLVFTDLYGPHKQSYSYVVRAVTEGRFVLPPIETSCMYNPEIMSINGSGEVKVIRGE